MGARFDHLVVAVEDLDEAAARWRAAGIPAERGGTAPGRHRERPRPRPGAGLRRAIAAGSESPTRGWAASVGARHDLVEDRRRRPRRGPTDPRGPGFGAPAVPGSRPRRTATCVAWRVCDVGAGADEGSMPSSSSGRRRCRQGRRDGPVVEGFTIVPPDPERVADLLLGARVRARPALAAAGLRGRPREGPMITVAPVGPPSVRCHVDDGLGDARRAAGGHRVSARTPSGATTRHDLDGVGVLTRPDRRRCPAAWLAPRTGRLGGRACRRLGARRASWRGSAPPRTSKVTWADVPALEVVSATRLDGPPGTQPVTVVRGTHPADERDVVVIGVGDPVEVIERQPDRPPPGSRVRQVGLVGRRLRARPERRGLRRARPTPVGGPALQRRGPRTAASPTASWSSGWRGAAAGRRTDGVVAGTPGSERLRQWSRETLGPSSRSTTVRRW